MPNPRELETISSVEDALRLIRDFRKLLARERTPQRKAPGWKRRMADSAWQQNHPRRPLPRWLIRKTYGKQRFLFVRQCPEYFCASPELNAWMASTKMLKDRTRNIR